MVTNKEKFRIWPEAIVIFRKSNQCYIGILNKVEAVNDLKDLGWNIHNIRRIQRDNLMFGLKKSSLGKNDDYRNQVKTSFVENAPETRDIYSVQWSQWRREICTATKQQFELEEPDQEYKNTSLRKAYGST